MARALEIPQFKTTTNLRRNGDADRLKQQWSTIRSLATPIWLREVSASLNGLGDLAYDWDSYGSQPVSKQALLAARMIFSRLDITDHPKPHTCAIAGGGVGVHWRIQSRDLELEIDPDGTIRYLQTILPGDMNEGTAEAAELQSILDWVIGR
jgi:hypothetical protein